MYQAGCAQGLAQQDRMAETEPHEAPVRAPPAEQIGSTACKTRRGQGPACAGADLVEDLAGGDLPAAGDCQNRRGVGRPGHVVRVGDDHGAAVGDLKGAGRDAYVGVVEVRQHVPARVGGLGVAVALRAHTPGPA